MTKLSRSPLPNLEKNQLDKLIEYKTVRSGFCAEGVPSNIDIVKSLQGSIARRIAMTSSKRRQLKELKQQLQLLNQDTHDHVPPAGDRNSSH